MATELRTALAILRLKQVTQRTALSRSTVYAMMARGAFPRNIALAARASGWIESEVESWLAARIAASRATLDVSKAAQ